MSDDLAAPRAAEQKPHSMADFLRLFLSWDETGLVYKFFFWTCLPSCGTVDSPILSTTFGMLFSRRTKNGKKEEKTKFMGRETSYMRMRRYRFSFGIIMMRAFLALGSFLFLSFLERILYRDPSCLFFSGLDHHECSPCVYREALPFLSLVQTALVAGGSVLTTYPPNTCSYVNTYFCF